MPLNMVTAMGGWVDRRSIDCYLRFAEVLFRRYKDVVKYWIPFNEINDLTTAVGNWNHGGILNHGTEDFSHQVDDRISATQPCTTSSLPAQRLCCWVGRSTRSSALAP